MGREAELAALQEFVDRDGCTRALVVIGDPGIGKTTLWDAGVDAARERGIHVLSTRASSAEAQLSYAGLIDLLDGIDTAELAQLPARQRQALDVALLRAEPVREEPADSQAIALGFLNALRALAERPLLIAVDDFPWLDAPSAEALTFAARRLEGHATVFLLARRPGVPPALEQALETGSLDRLEVSQLSYGAIRRLLSERLGLTLPRHLLRRLVDSTLGNPLFALELGRELTARGLPAVGEDLPLPDAVEDLLGTRVARLPPPTRRLLLATALSADLTTSQLGAIGGSDALEDAVDAGVLLVEATRVRASHPLLAAAAKKRSRPRARRELHLELAGVVTDEELRARHLAFAAENPDEGLAATVAAAAAAASARGARQEAVELAEQALRLTPPGAAGERTERLLSLGRYLAATGEEQRLTALLTPEVDSMPREARARAHLLLTDGAVSHIDECMDHLEHALDDAGDNRELRGRALARKALYMAICYIERLAEADAWAQQALADAPALHPGAELEAIDALAWTSILRGRGVDDLRERSRALSDDAVRGLDSIDRVAAVRLAWRGRIGEARELFLQLRATADERGEMGSYVVMRQHLCELALRAGAWDEAARLLDEWRESADGALLVAPSYQRCLALLAAGRGIPDEIESLTAQVRVGADASGLRWSLLETLRAHGIAALLAHQPSRAAESLRRVWSHTEREGVEDPGAFSSAPDLVEALLELGATEEARAVSDRLRALADEQEHPWGRASAKRCDALVRLAEGTDEEHAWEDLEHAAAAYAELGLRFDQARTLLLLGRAQRRRRKWALARDALERAVAAFEAIGSPGWVAETRSELGRVGARRPQAEGKLSPAERRAAELAAEGLSNKQIAQTLFVTVKTVEAHLSHAYSKLGVRSRSQLAGALASRG